MLRIQSSHSTSPVVSLSLSPFHLSCCPENRWLAEWLLENNPNKPTVAHADDQRPEGDEEEQEEAAAVEETQVMGMVATVESRLQE